VTLTIATGRDQSWYDRCLRLLVAFLAFTGARKPSWSRLELSPGNSDRFFGREQSDLLIIAASTSTVKIAAAICWIDIAAAYSSRVISNRDSDLQINVDHDIGKVEL
jgi:hypothetical protein